MSEPKRWMLEWDEDKGCSCGQKEHPQGDFVYYSVYAEVKAGWQAASSRAISYIGQLGDQSAELARLNSLIANTERDNARLKAEVERLKEGNECLDQMHEKEMARSAFLCEEVNRTTSWGRGLESDLSWARAELLMVKAEVERLKNNVAYLDTKLDEELDK